MKVDSYCLLIVIFNALCSSTKASRSSYRQYTSHEAIERDHDYTTADPVSQMQQMSLAESYPNNNDDYDPAAYYTWLQPEQEISEGPSLATRMMEEEEEDTASTQFQASTSSHQEEYEIPSGEGSYAEMDPTSIELAKQTSRRIVHSAVAWHADIEDKYIGIFRVFINMVMMNRRIDSRKSFRRIADTLTPEIIAKVQDIYDRLDGWPRHDALSQLAVETAQMTLQYSKTWKKGHTLQEVEELKRLIKASGRVKGGNLLRCWDLQSRKNALIPGTKENKRITKVFTRREGVSDRDSTKEGSV